MKPRSSSPILLALGSHLLLAGCGGGGAGTAGDLASLAAPDMSSAGPQLVPPAAASSGGSDGEVSLRGTVQHADAITYRLIVPDEPARPVPLLIVFSGTEGGARMANNLVLAGPGAGIDGFVIAVLDGVDYRGKGEAGATVMDDVRARYDIDNDRTYLLGESAGTTAALALGFELRPSYFAAYWANDVNAWGAPAQTAAELGFAPWGQVGPGGDFRDAETIVDGMRSAGYRLPDPAPYDGAGHDVHGHPEQFKAALAFFPDKTRQ